MTAPNHAITGALIGLSLGGSPLLAVFLAFLSHFLLDAIPHYDPPGSDSVNRIRSKRFLREHIFIGGSICVLLVAVLAAAHPTAWVLGAICAFTATVPDLLFIPRYVHIQRTGVDNINQHGFWKFHHRIQWFQKPIGIWVEVAWFAGAGALLLAIL